MVRERRWKLIAAMDNVGDVDRRCVNCGESCCYDVVAGFDDHAYARWLCGRCSQQQQHIMSHHLQPYVWILKKIVRMREAKRREYLRDCDRDIIDCFSECAKNVLDNNSL